MIYCSFTLPLLSTVYNIFHMNFDAVDVHLCEYSNSKFCSWIGF